MATKTQDPGTADDTGQEHDPYAGAQGHNQAAGDSSVPQGIDPGSAPNSYDPYAGMPGHNQPSGDASDPRSMPTGQVHSPYDTAGNTDSDPKSDLHPASKPDDKDKKSEDNKDHKKSDTSSDTDSEASPGWLRDSESNPDENAGFARGFEEPEKKGIAGRFSPTQTLNPLSRRRRRGFIIGAIVSAIVSVAISILTFIPLKIEHMVQNLQDRFFSTSQQALRTAMRYATNDYIIKYVLPEYKNCGTTIDRKCKVNIARSTGPGNAVVNMYREWSNSRFENKLYEQYKIEFKFDKYAGPKGTWRMIAPGSPEKGYDIGYDGGRLETLIDDPNFAKVSARFDDAIEGVSYWKKVYLRYKFGGVAHDRGISRCFFFCKLKKKVTDPVVKPLEQRKQAAKILLVQRVLTPRNQLVGVALECILTPGCHPEDRQANGTDPPTSQVEDEQRTTLKELGDREGVPDYDALENEYKKMSEKGFQRYSTEAVLNLVFKEATTTKIADAIPIIGWINLGAETINTANDAAAKTKVLAYGIAAALVMKQFYNYRGYADEIHIGNLSGEVDSAEMGSMVDTLGPGKQLPDDPLVGGTASAEEAPLYDEVMGTQPSNKPNPDNYTCNDGKKVPTGMRVCPEELLGIGNLPIKAFNAAHDFVNFACLSPFGAVPTSFVEDLPVPVPCTKLTTMAQLWRGSIGKILEWGGDAVGFLGGNAAKVAFAPYDATCGLPVKPLPGNDAYCAAKDAVDQVAPQLISAVTNWVLPNPWGTNMGGGRVFQTLASGAFASGTAMCQAVGCQNVTSLVAADITNQELAYNKLRFEQKPLMARMFDTSTSYSLVSRLAIATPFSMQASLENNLTGTFLNPLSGLSRGFGGLLGSHSASAVDEASVNPFNGDLMAVQKKDIPKEPSKYWDEHNCGDTSDAGQIAQWQKKASEKTSDKTGMPYYDDPSPCLLLTEMASSGTARFDKSALSDRDKAGIEGEGADSTAGAAPTTEINEADLFKDSTDIACAEGSKDVGVHTAYHAGNSYKIRLCALEDMPSTSEDSTPGNSFYIEGADGKALVNSRVSQNFVNLVKAAKADNIPMKANSSFRSMEHQTQLCNGDGGCSSGNYTTVAKPGTSNHQAGVAIDFAMANQSKYSLSRSNCVNIKGVCSAPGDKVWEWLKKNASKYGLKQYSNEFWHWSPNGS